MVVGHNYLPHMGLSTNLKYAATCTIKRPNGPNIRWAHTPFDNLTTKVVAPSSSLTPHCSFFKIQSYQNFESELFIFFIFGSYFILSVSQWIMLSNMDLKSGIPTWHQTCYFKYIFIIIIICKQQMGKRLKHYGVELG